MKDYARFPWGKILVATYVLQLPLRALATEQPIMLLVADIILIPPVLLWVGALIIRRRLGKKEG